VGLLILVLAALAAYYWFGRPIDRTPEHLRTVTVTHIRDGDTIEYDGKKPVRYIGIDTPETGQPGADSATAFNAALVMGREVRLEFGRDSLDRYERELAWIFVDGRMANMELLKAGWARCYFFRGNLKYSSQMIRAVRQAMENKRGLWAMPRTETEDYYVGSHAGFRFHRPDCSSASDIKKSNQRVFPVKDSAFYDGLAPCGRCRP
jgi:micrococcal nuclease